MMEKLTVTRLGLAIMEAIFSALGFLGLVAMCWCLAILNDRLAMAWMVGSFGASITLILACPESSMSQPYPALVGNGVSAVIGVCVQQWMHGFGLVPMSAIAMSLSVGAMCLLRALHSPGGATALLAIMGGRRFIALDGFTRSSRSRSARYGCWR